MSRPHKRTTTTTLILEELVRADDLLTVRDLRERLPSESLNRITAALHHLHIHRAVQCIDSDRRLWWFATPQDDDRHRVLQEVREGIVRNRTANADNRPEAETAPSQDGAVRMG